MGIRGLGDLRAVGDRFLMGKFLWGSGNISGFGVSLLCGVLLIRGVKTLRESRAGVSC